MKRGRPRKKLKAFKIDLKHEAALSVLAVVIIIVALLSLISFFVSGYKINDMISEKWRYYFGNLAFFGPLFLLLVGTFLIPSLKHKFKEPRILIGVVLLFISLLGIFHIFISKDDALDIAQNGNGGGWFGYMISAFLINIISVYGGIITLFGLGAISILVIFNITLDQILEKAAAVLKVLKIPDLLKFTRRPRQENDDEDVEITQGMPIDEEDDTESSVKSSDELVPFAVDAEKMGSLAVEVVPSPSEPLTDSLVPSQNAVSTLAPGTVAVPALPYADKVWKNPTLDLLDEVVATQIDNGDTEARKKIIFDTLKSFDIDVRLEDVKTGPSVTQYQLKAEQGIKVAKIAGLDKNLAMALASPTGSVRIEAPIPGKSSIGIEVPNNSRALVSIKSLLSSDAWKGSKSKLGILLGKDVAGKIYTYDIGKMPHMLIAGTTGSGKSVFIHNLMFSILYKASPAEVKFILVDPKRVELSHYADIPHLITPVVKDVSKSPSVFKWAMEEMDRRYKLFDQAHARSIDDYNNKSGFQAMPYLVIVVDELADIMLQDPAGVEKSIIRIAQLGRAAGVHLVIAIQRPDARILTGSIKANIPCRVAFNVMSQIDSRVIIDQTGAEKLLGRGDMLFIPPDMSKPIRLQGAYVSDKEITSLTNFLKSQGYGTSYREDIVQSTDRQIEGGGGGGMSDVDDLFDQSVEIVRIARRASSSMLQTKLSIGYARAARILEQLEEHGVVGPSNGQKPREVLIGMDYNQPQTQTDSNTTDFEDSQETQQY